MKNLYEKYFNKNWSSDKQQEFAACAQNREHDKRQKTTKIQLKKRDKSKRA